MSLGLVAWCRNGIALCADSRSSFPDPASSHTRIASDCTEKLFRVGKCGVVTSGAGTLCNRTIFSHMEDFKDAHKSEPPSVVAEQLAIAFRTIVDQHLVDYPQQVYLENAVIIDFLVGGYEDDKPKCFRASVFQQAAGATQTIDTQWGPVIARNGRVSFRLNGEFNISYIGDVDVVLSLNANRNFPIALFGLQDSVDLVYFLAQASERTKHFSSGDGSAFGMNRTIGGPFDVAVIRRKHGFEAIQKKELAVREQIEAAPVVPKKG